MLANGCFDLLHAGHVEHLREASAMGDVLVVGLTADSAIGKPGRPIIPWKDRAEMLLALKFVDIVSCCDNAVEAIMHWQPSVFVKGIDYEGVGVLPQERAACDAVGAEIRFTKSTKRSTTEIIEKIRRMV